MPKISLQWFLIRRIAFWGVVLAAAVGLFFFVRAFTICWRLTSLAGIPPASCAGEAVSPLETPVVGNNQNTPSPTLTPEPSESEDIEYPTWDGGSRINILFVGLRGGEPTEADCPFCTDTLILLTVDPIAKTAGMLSIPRDMWVNIPGFGYSRINTAWTLGRGSKLPGGGPALTMKTVSHFIGVPVDYYVQVDFDTFVDIIDLIDGVDVYNEETMVIFGIRDKMLSPENFPKLIAQAPKLYNTFSSGIHTNLSLEDAIKLAVMVKDIPKENIKNAVIDNHMIAFDSVILGGQKASIMKPLPDKIRILRDEIFTSSGPASPMAQDDPRSLMQADRAHIRVLNGTSTAQLDRRTLDYLLNQGLLVTESGTTKPSSRTVIILYSPKLYALKFLMNIFGITKSPQILIKPDPTQTVDIEVRLGNDWIDKLPTGY